MLAAFEIDAARIGEEVAATGLAIVRPGEGFEEVCASAKQDYSEAFRATAVKPAKQGLKPADLAAGPWRKYTIGSKNGVGEAYAQLLQTTYFAPGPSSPSLTRLFEIIIALRNQLMHVASDFGVSPVRDGFWNAC